MKLIIENNTDISQQQILKVVYSEYDGVYSDFITNGCNFVHRRLYTLLIDNKLVDVILYINRIKTGFTFKFYRG